MTAHAAARRGFAASVAAAVLLCAGVPAAQSWRAPALASFDEAWQTIQDTFYDPAFGGLDWTAVRRELRPRVESAATPDDARSVIVEMLGRLKRSHFALLSGSAADALPGPAAVPVDIRITKSGVLIIGVTNASASAMGFAPGQTLLTVDGKPVDDLLRGSMKNGLRAADLEAWRRVNRVLHGGEGSPVTVRVKDADGTVRTIAAKRVLPAGESIALGNLPPLMMRFEARDVSTPRGRRAGLIAFSIWMAPVAAQIDAAIDRFREYDGVVLDLRGNPGGLAGMMSGVAGHFLGDPVLLGTMHTRQATLKFEANPRLVAADGRKVDVYRGPLAILVDELTGSTSETFVGSLQGLGRARVFGRQTMGQALPALTKQLPSGDVLIYAIGDFTTSAGKSLEGTGVVPDVSISLSPRSLAAGRDEVLDAALAWLDTAVRHP